MTSFNPGTTALLLVDIQPDFMPGGPLACDRGDSIVGPVRELMQSRDYGHVVATQDWHPAGHISFASSHPGTKPFQTIPLYGEDQVLWPDHCVQGSRGAGLHDGLPLELVDVIIRKGSDPKVDSYSAFRNNIGPDGERPTTGLAGWLRERGVTTVHVCGLARDVCALWTAEDAAEAGFETHFLWDLTRPVEDTEASNQATRAALGRAGVHVI
ncbi:nicotinamidase/pyrazinamidase [Natronocella acetinitrilica]|uniref:nicotinamidase n=1 Tax=Natronocella acetinitrilica TaxID=414046 RepID=A0AAE3G911_9GAMM|nr:nicotinamidase [Natronocella acetinitrilica]MCP1677036.1 nicotinamidase/pyrazinamidase [Natronocella acetinitrilica]